MATTTKSTASTPDRPPAQGEFDPKNPATWPYHGDPDAIVQTAGPMGEDRIQTNEPSNWSKDDPKHLILVGGVPGLPIGDPTDFVLALTMGQKGELEAARRASRGKGGRDAKPGVLDIKPPPLQKMPDWLQPGVPPPPDALEAQTTPAS